ncbi:MAG: HD domain-containing phosphohydrolase [Pseudomonadota bacterium]
MSTRISIDNLIEIVRTGGQVKTGIDVYNAKGTLLLEKDILVNKVKILELIRENGINSLPIDPALNGGFWDSNGKQIKMNADGMLEYEEPETKSVVDLLPEGDVSQFDIDSLFLEDNLFGKEDQSVDIDDGQTIFPDMATNEIEVRLLEIEEIKKQASVKYDGAKQNIKKVLNDIKLTGGEFDFDEVEHNVSDLVDFLVIADNPFSYLTQEIISYDDYLYNHSINVCAIGTAVVNLFNTHFSNFVDDLIKGEVNHNYTPLEQEIKKTDNSFTCYYKEELGDIALGFFLHDIGKILVDDRVLNKEGPLTAVEFDLVRKHSYEHGITLMDRNHLKNSVVRNIIKYHHAPLFESEDRCYPLDKPFNQLPIYVRICKLADIYDAMTSRRCYKEAVNPINVVTQIFRTYAKKDTMLKHVLHAFVKSIGIYPPGSIVYLKNGQMAYVLESKGPLVIPFTDNQSNTLRSKPDPISIGFSENEESKMVDNSRSVKTPMEVYNILPSYIKKIVRHP